MPTPASGDPIRVKLISKARPGENHSNWLDRFPGRAPVWGRCRFVFDETSRDYDWLVVYDDLPGGKGERFTLGEEHLACPAHQTLLITTEPSTIKVYGSRYTNQFGHVLTSQEPWVIRHPGAIYSQPALIWYYGGTGHGLSHDHRGTYDSIARFVPSDKRREISTVCSAKQQSHTLHRDRYAFTQKLKANLPELEVFGHGVRYLEDKADALDTYRHHVAIENHVCTHHWTEKLADCFLGATLPIYHGCPNYADYFPEESVVPINIHDFEGSLETIRRTIRDGEYTKRLPAILEARRLVLEKYSLFPVIAGIVELHHGHPPPPGLETGDRILSRHALRRRHPVGSLFDGIEKIRVGLRHRLS